MYHYLSLPSITFSTQLQKNLKIKLISIHHPLETNGLHAITERTIRVHENWQYLLVPLIRPNQVLQAKRGEFP